MSRYGSDGVLAYVDAEKNKVSKNAARSDEW